MNDKIKETDECPFVECDAKAETHFHCNLPNNICEKGCKTKGVTQFAIIDSHFKQKHINEPTFFLKDRIKILFAQNRIKGEDAIQNIKVGELEKSSCSLHIFLFFLIFLCYFDLFVILKKQNHDINSAKNQKHKNKFVSIENVFTNKTTRNMASKHFKLNTSIKNTFSFLCSLCNCIVSKHPKQSNIKALKTNRNCECIKAKFGYRKDFFF